MSERHTEALAHLIYGITESGGFIQLTGEVGTGKTTLIRSLLQQLPETTDIALILNPQLSATEFLAAILSELGVNPPDDLNSVKALTDALNQFLLKNYSRGRRTVLIVDEAQNFAVDVLEQIRLLTNLETIRQKLLQITLIGQPELRDMLARNDLRQLAQRITGRYHLESLGRNETSEYIDHRLRVAGASSTIFSPAACKEMYQQSNGIPRLINVIADRALLGAFTREQHEVTPKLVRDAAGEVYDRPRKKPVNWISWLRSAALATIVAIFAVALAWVGMTVTGPVSQPVAATNASSEDTETVVAQTEPAPTEASAPATPVLSAPAETEEPEPGVTAANELDKLLQAGDGSTTLNTAFQTLFGLWGAEYSPSRLRACEQAEQFGLHCLFQRGSLSQVQSLDRPAILTVRDSHGLNHQVVLANMDEQNGMLYLGDELYRVRLNEIADIWFGEYLLLWRPQSGAFRALYPGMSDPTVKWLRQSLVKIQHREIDPIDSEYYDKELVDRVEEFQRENRLNVDGLVGQRTQITINSSINKDSVPRLAKTE
ncbi:MAG: AAA family ATPase [Gammaproteobacteria bacterium]